MQKQRCADILKDETRVNRTVLASRQTQVLKNMHLGSIKKGSLKQ